MADNPFRIDLQRLSKGTIKQDIKVQPEELGLDDVDGFLFENKVTGKLMVALGGDDVFVTGTLETTATGQCMRCLGPADCSLKSNIGLTYVKDQRDAELPLDETAKGPVIDSYSGDTIEAKEQLRETLLLELPDIPRCSNDCKGLCPACGANLNEGACPCEPEDQDEEVPMPDPANEWKDKLRQIKID